MTTTRTRRRYLQELLSFGCASTLTGCATLIHPERQGNGPGRIDVAPLLLDILWFIPGLVPGIIALAVDFGTGAIYLDRPRAAGRRVGERLAIAPGERVTVRAPRSRDDVEVTLRLSSPRGTLLDEACGRWSPTRRDDLQVAFTPVPEGELGDGQLELVVRHRGSTATAVHPLHLHLRPA
jgi:hypothetical protein